MLVNLSVSISLSINVSGCGSTGFTAPVKDVSKPKVSTTPRIKPLPPVPAGFYRVKPGDTLFRIAFENGVDYPSLAAWNQLSDSNNIQVGMRLRLSEPSSPTKPALPKDIVEAPPSQWVWPSEGQVIGRFGENQSKGIVIAGLAKQPVVAATNGQIAYAGDGLRGYGKLIIIRHGKRFLSAYAHNERILVREGQQVGTGQIIAEMGKSDADRIKLHFEIRELGKPVDPMAYLPNNGLKVGQIDAPKCCHTVVQLRHPTIVSD